MLSTKSADIRREAANNINSKAESSWHVYSLQFTFSQQVMSNFHWCIFYWNILVLQLKNTKKLKVFEKQEIFWLLKMIFMSVWQCRITYEKIIIFQNVCFLFSMQTAIILVAEENMISKMLYCILLFNMVQWNLKIYFIL